jgi:hypothetical protein
MLSGVAVSPLCRLMHVIVVNGRYLPGHRTVLWICMCGFGNWCSLVICLSDLSTQFVDVLAKLLLGHWIRWVFLSIRLE